MKTTYNKSKIFKSAWTMIKNYGFTLSEALVQAWKYAKENAKLIDLGVIARETEKAVAVEMSFTSYGSKWDRKTLVWFPKSMMVGNAVPNWMYEQKISENFKR